VVMVVAVGAVVAVRGGGGRIFEAPRELRYAIRNFIDGLEMGWIVGDTIGT
jgi:hypothetical protein